MTINSIQKFFFFFLVDNSCCTGAFKTLLAPGAAERRLNTRTTTVNINIRTEQGSQNVRKKKKRNYKILVAKSRSLARIPFLFCRPFLFFLFSLTQTLVSFLLFFCYIYLRTEWDKRCAPTPFMYARAHRFLFLFVLRFKEKRILFLRQKNRQTKEKRPVAKDYCASKHSLFSLPRFFYV